MQFVHRILPSRAQPLLRPTLILKQQSVQHFLKLNLITHITSSPNFSYPAYEKFILNAAVGGVTSVQLRFKNQPLSSIRPFALRLKEILEPFYIPLIVNDSVELAVEIKAHGVHLGQSDMCPTVARKILGEKAIIGWSIESMEELALANELDCLTYVTASAVFPSKTKTDCKKIWGLEGLRQIAQSSRHPVTAIGGVKSHNVAEIVKHGAVGVSVIGAIHDSLEPRLAAKQLLKLIDENLHGGHRV